ncbi:MAG: hypothetical protein R3D58_22380 [Saprospiraceae bacterium]
MKNQAIFYWISVKNRFFLFGWPGRFVKHPTSLFPVAGYLATGFVFLPANQKKPTA